MFGTIRKHSKWLWLVIIVVIIISFVVFFSPNVSLDGVGRPKMNLTLEGRTFSRDQLNAAVREVQVSALLGLARRPESNEEATQRALERLLLQIKLEQYGISVGPEAAAAWIRDRIMRDGGPFSGMTFIQVADQFIKPAGLSADDLQRFARNQAGFELLLETIGTAAALITPQEIEAAYRRDNQRLEVEVAYVANSNFLAKVTLDPAEVTKFYSNRVAAYRSPDRVQVHYVRFASADQEAAAEAALTAGGSLDDRLTRTYEQRGTNYYPGLTMEEAKGRIRQEMIDQDAFQLAKRKAYDFINTYYESPFEGGAARAADVLAASARAVGLEAKTTNPFSRDERPEGLAAGPEFVDAAFELTAQEPFSTAVSAADGYYALAFHQRIPGTPQPFEAVKDRVESEYRVDQARTLALEAADQFYDAATNAVASGQSFTALAELSGFQTTRIPALTLRTTTVPGFTLPVDIRQITSIANNMETNSVSRAQFAADGLLIVRTGARSEPAAEDMATGLAEYRSSMRQARESEVLNSWLTRQMEIGGIQNVLRNPTR
jgi:peptidyl-prolyl cis-trans isomerase D